MPEDAEAFLADCAREVERFLDGVLPRDDGYSAPLAKAMRYSTLGAGKRIRPAVTMAASLAVGGVAGDALSAAASVEMIHAYSLIHDDLPCMDDDDLRRGRPSAHRAFGEAAAVLAGDALQALAFETLAAGNATGATPAPVRAESVRRLAAAAGHAGMVGGQAADLGAEGRAPEPAALDYIHRRKTGALLGAAAALGALAGGGSPEQVDDIEEIGRELGLVFQIVDDLLDREETSRVLGKSAGKDERAGKTTWPGVHGEGAAREAARSRADAVRRRLADFAADGGRRGDAAMLSALAERILNRRS